MDIGIGLPNALLDLAGPDLLTWGVRAEDAGFATVATIGRVAYQSHEELVALAAVAGATRRIGLITSVLVAPPRQPVLLAKQASTLARVSGGRLRLGLGIGGRDDDWVPLGVTPEHRGERMEETIATLRSVWAGEPPQGTTVAVGPSPTTVPIVLGGYSEPAFRRAGRLGDGFLAGPMPPEAVAAAWGLATEAAAAAGRPTPRLTAARYVALGDDVHAEADRNAAAYYGFGGPDQVRAVQQGALRTPGAVRDTVAALADIGASEVLLWPLATPLDQVARIADAAR